MTIENTYLNPFTASDYKCFSGVESSDPRIFEVEGSYENITLILDGKAIELHSEPGELVEENDDASNVSEAYKVVFPSSEAANLIAEFMAAEIVEKDKSNQVSQLAQRFGLTLVSRL